MSLVRTEITLKNARDIYRAEEGSIEELEIRKLTMDVMVDTGAWTLVINEEVRKRLGLEVSGIEEGTLADGKKEYYDMAGPVEILWKTRRALCDALVLPDAEDILLGAIPLEIMDLTINPRRELVGAHGDNIMHRI